MDDKALALIIGATSAFITGSLTAIVNAIVASRRERAAEERLAVTRSTSEKLTSLYEPLMSIFILGRKEPFAEQEDELLRVYLDRATMIIGSNLRVAEQDLIDKVWDWNELTASSDVPDNYTEVLWLHDRVKTRFTELRKELHFT